MDNTKQDDNLSKNNITLQVDFAKTTVTKMVINVVIEPHEKLLYDIIKNTIKEV